MTPSTRKPKRISVPLTTAEVEALQRLADAGDRSVSWVAARAIRAYLAEQEKVQTPMREELPRTAE